MSNTPQQPADGWQSPQQPPVYRPNEQPPEEPPPWSPESQRMSGMSQQQPGPVEADGTVKYVGGPGHQSPPQYGPPPGVPISPFDQPQMSPQPMPQQMPAADPFGGGGGVPVSGMPVSGMPPVSSIPTSGMPVSSPVYGQSQPQYGQQPPYGQPPFGGGQFGPQGGQLVPVSGGGGGSQPWGTPDTIKRKKKGGKGPMWLLLVGIVVIAAALGVGGFILFNPGGDSPSDDDTGTIESPAPAEPALVAGPGTLKFFASGAVASWAAAAEPPAMFSDSVGVAAEDGSGTVYIGILDAAQVGGADAAIADADTAFTALLGAQLGAPDGEITTQAYWVDGRDARFHSYTSGDLTVIAAIVQVDGGFEAFVGTASADSAEALETASKSLRFGEL
ncbi:hypothetical protein GCM10009830_11700 [Glycomyces endophyticus]|uniref:Uncharacterized protein n=1 Tax=Glycomyces endophyticus TaxID=480996 RepID=A0ABP4S5F0_9ACTN